MNSVNSKRIAIDLDGTLCTEGPASERSLAKPNPAVVEMVRRAVADGHLVFIFSARPWSDYRMTVKWLEDNGIVFAELILGKLNYDFFLDDRASPCPTKLKEFLDAQGTPG